MHVWWGGEGSLWRLVQRLCGHVYRHLSPVPAPLCPSPCPRAVATPLSPYPYPPPPPTVLLHRLTELPSARCSSSTT